jgi:5-methylcytosine-specific restriction enzyme A
MGVDCCQLPAAAPSASASANAKAEGLRSQDARLIMGVRGKPGPWAELYSTARWQRIRRHQLREHALCKYCAETGIVEPATICDHVEPHHGDRIKFWSGPFQSLCKRCHDSAKRHVELHGYRPDVGLDGWPLDPRHPVYARGR